MNALDLADCIPILAQRFIDAKQQLNALDREIGDGDHGTTMARGFGEARNTVKHLNVTSATLVGEVLRAAATAFASATGGAAGALFSSILMEIGKACGTDVALSSNALHLGLVNALARIQELGGARPGDKSMVDALAPAVDVVGDARAAGNGLCEILRLAGEAAAAGADATVSLSAKCGRAQYTKDGGAGHMDPGAHSVALILKTLHESLLEIAPSFSKDSHAESFADGGVQMKKLINDPEEIVEDMLDGYVAAFENLVARADNPRVIVRRNPKPANRVGIAIGNGSGHEPIAVGWIGEGMLDANAVGDVFVAPPAEVIADALAEADRGSGALLLISQHAGDVINGRMAIDLVRDRGIRAEALIMYDDVASAPKGQEKNRRGAPGTTFVYKILGAAAEEGIDLGELKNLGERVRDGTRTLAAALSTGISPITGEPMFELPADRIFMGMGVTGEPGMGEQPMAKARDLVATMLPRIIDDLPYRAGDEVLVLINGAGATTLMELLIVYKAVDKHLRGMRITNLEPLIGNFVTTQDTAGFSISLCKVGPDIKRLWAAPAKAPYFDRHSRGDI